MNHLLFPQNMNLYHWLQIFKEPWQCLQIYYDLWSLVLSNPRFHQLISLQSSQDKHALERDYIGAIICAFHISYNNMKQASLPGVRIPGSGNYGPTIPSSKQCDVIFSCCWDIPVALSLPITHGLAQRNLIFRLLTPTTFSKFLDLPWHFSLLLNSPACLSSSFLIWPLSEEKISSALDL